MAERQDGPILVLFDVDMTIRDPETGAIRPAFGLLINDLNQMYGERVRKGLMYQVVRTQRDKEQAERYLPAGITDAVDQEEFFGSGNASIQADPILEAL